ncbi:hypothetical protein B5D80_19620 [Micromonospora wenchangensis]|uniref:TniQ domain-containing protein n=1 Tax=Micromonospora wenchangensis TaxID=1185415 RepID=A0A246RJH2_9ACTN|nr:TniQ family protein [Micromonospora wenchangensis]OWV04705.1 hypothetical protein B5D80_19620 [Micromonospora wenchangensis]
MTPAAGGGPRLRRLPCRVAPVPDETLESYLCRLAVGNHLARDLLVEHLSTTGRRGRRRLHLIPLQALAAVTGFTETRLAHALPEVRQHEPHLRTRTLIGRVLPVHPNQQRPWCRRCAAGRGITGPVTIWARCDYAVCLRHRLWVGRGVHHGDDQLGIADFPDITHAQVRLRRLIRRHGYPRVRHHFLNAYDIQHELSRNPFAMTPANDRLRRLHAREHTQFLPWAYVYAAQFPEVVTVLAVISSPFWRRAAISLDGAERERFFDEMSRRTEPHPVGHTRALHSWIYHQRRPPLPDDPDGERLLRPRYIGATGVIPPPEPSAEARAADHARQ